MVKKILIIDDDARNIFALSAVLKSKGFTCRSANSALEGLDILNSSNEIGVVLLDMMMPELDGYELLSRIRTGSIADMPVIATTAQAMVGDRERCIEAGANDYLSKPIDVDLLLRLLHNYMK